MQELLSKLQISPAAPPLDTQALADLLALTPLLDAALSEVPQEDPIHAVVQAQKAHVATLLAAKQGFDPEVASRLAAQFSQATDCPGASAIELYRTLGWDAALDKLRREYDFEPLMGPVCLWSDTEDGWWVQDIGWGDYPWAAAGFAAFTLTSPTKPGQRAVLWSQVQEQEQKSSAA